jgi:hypothetical protein
MVTLPHQRLIEWFKLEDERLQLEQFEYVFAADAKLDDQFGLYDRVLDRVKVFASLRDIRAIVAEGDAVSGAVVLEGRDPVTNLWHREAWAFSVRGGRISKVTSTTSPGLDRGDRQ